MIDRSSLIVITATSLETKCARRELPGIEVLEVGVSLTRWWRGAKSGEVVVSCGLAGGLTSELPTGTVLIPDEVGRLDGTKLICDPEVVSQLRKGAHSLGIEPVADPIITSAAIVSGPARATWAQRGYVGADMETGMIVDSATPNLASRGEGKPRVAAVRVILDTPLHELSKDWLNPALAMLKPWNWPQALWLGREAPRCARLAARVIAAALQQEAPA